jgi:hypothetical protein
MEIMILVGLNAVVGIILFLNGLSTGGLELPTALPSFGGGIPAIITGIMPILGAFELPIGLAFLGSAAGLFLGKGWAWSMSRALQIAGIALGFAFLFDAAGQLATMGLYVLGMALSGVVVGFLYAPEVKEFYGKNIIPRAAKRQRRRKRQYDDEDAEEEQEESSAAEVE